MPDVHSPPISQMWQKLVGQNVQRANVLGAGCITIFRSGPTIDLRDRMDNIRTNLPRIEMSMSYTRSGLHVQDMTSQLRDFFGVAGNDGVLVTSVERNSAAEKAGLKAGDVITGADNRNIRTPYDFQVELRGTGKVTLRVVREKKEMDIVFDRGSDTR